MLVDGQGCGKDDFDEQFMPRLTAGIEEALELPVLSVAQIGLIVRMVENQALYNVIQRPGAELRGDIRGTLELERTRLREFDGATHPIRMIGRSGQCLESITPVEEHAKSSVAPRHGVDGAQPQHLEPRDPLRIGADLGG